jgi:hypothetical protein
MVIGVEGKDLLGLRLAFLLDDVWRSQPSPSSSRSRPACMVLDRQSAYIPKAGNFGTHLP